MRALPVGGQILVLFAMTSVSLEGARNIQDASERDLETRIDATPPYRVATSDQDPVLLDAGAVQPKGSRSLQFLRRECLDLFETLSEGSIAVLRAGVGHLHRSARI